MIYKCGIIREHCLDDPVQYKPRLEEAFRFYKNKQVKPFSPEAQQWRRIFSHPDSADGVPDVDIEGMGLFDTVGALGVPERWGWSWINNRLCFHDTTISRLVGYAVQLVAADETRDVFCHTPIEKTPGSKTKLEQIYVPGNHSAVGGGVAATEKLSDSHALLMVERLEKNTGLAFDHEKLTSKEHRYGLKPDPLHYLDGKYQKSRLYARNSPRSPAKPGDEIDHSFILRAEEKMRRADAVRNEHRYNRPRSEHLPPPVRLPQVARIYPDMQGVIRTTHSYATGSQPKLEILRERVGPLVIPPARSPWSHGAVIARDGPINPERPIFVEVPHPSDSWVIRSANRSTSSEGRDV